jgi:hypothetical protein
VLIEGNSFDLKLMFNMFSQEKKGKPWVVEAQTETTLFFYPVI